mmetsp:Transcript_37127/g.56969  ORF Transcript_37127/g.56969 Transcript_37127/m.56969 type:complete len:142 (-) Transcript_37127:2104-2529(-)
MKPISPKKLRPLSKQASEEPKLLGKRKAEEEVELVSQTKFKKTAEQQPLPEEESQPMSAEDKGVKSKPGPKASGTLSEPRKVMTPYVIFSREFIKKRREELRIVFSRPGRKPTQQDLDKDKRSKKEADDGNLNGQPAHIVN